MKQAFPRKKNSKFAASNNTNIRAVKPMATDQQIAIIGTAFRLPQANNSDELWTLLENKTDAITTIPKSRWDSQSYFHPTPATAGKMSTQFGGFIELPEPFESTFFGISPREAEKMDPQQKLLLEVAWDAFENAGLTLQELDKTKTGVFVGISSQDFAAKAQNSQDKKDVDAYYGSGRSHSFASGRLSHYFGLRGPSLSIDTACSSSLVAINTAVNSLRSGESDLALAAGVNLILSPNGMISMSQGRMMAADGRCKAFDDSADGFSRGEGCGVLILATLESAKQNGFPIAAIIRGTSTNHTGNSSNLTVPSAQSQIEIMQDALNNAGVSANEVDYLEAHGTGTSVGDLIEAEAIQETFGERTSTHSTLMVGSIKSNIGHLEAAAGVAGVIKCIESMKRNKIPAHLHFKNLRKNVTWNSKQISIPSDTMKWRVRPKPRIAMVNSLGFSGTNASLVLQQGQEPNANRKTLAANEKQLPNAMTLSAHTSQALEHMALRLRQQLRNNPEINYTNLVYSSNSRRNHLEQRLAVLANNRETALEQLEHYIKSTPTELYEVGCVVRSLSENIVFSFPSKFRITSKALNKLRHNYYFFDQFIKKIEKALPPIDGSPFDYLRHHDVVQTGNQASLQAHAVQFAVQAGLALLLRTFGIVPKMCFGNGVGELAADYVAARRPLADLLSELTTLTNSLHVQDKSNHCVQRSGLGQFKPSVELILCGSSNEDHENTLQFSAGDDIIHCSVAQALAKLWVQGQPVNWSRLDSNHAEFVALPNYPWRKDPQHKEQDGAILIAEKNLSKMQELAITVNHLMSNFGDEGVFAYNRRFLAPNVFISSKRKALFLCAKTQRSLSAFMYAGPPEYYLDTFRELRQWAHTNHLVLHVFCSEDRVSQLSSQGLAITQIGLNHRLLDLSTFNLEGGHRRKLRYLVKRYQRDAHIKVQEYQQGTDSSLDQDLAELFKAWSSLKSSEVHNSQDLFNHLLNGSLDTRYRIFTTLRDGRLDCAVILAPCPNHDGYLLDIEIYDEKTHLGALEFSIWEIIKLLSEQGSSYLGLGGTYGTQLKIHSGNDQKAFEFMHTLHLSGLLNGDANVQFKNKFGATKNALYFCRSLEDKNALSDIVKLLSGTTQASKAIESANNPTHFVQEIRSLHSIESAHRVDDQAVLPGAFFIDAIVNGSEATTRKSSFTLSNIVMLRPLILENDHYPSLEFGIDRESTPCKLRLHSSAESGVDADNLRARVDLSKPPACAGLSTDIFTFSEESISAIDGLYKKLADNSIQHGPEFKLITDLKSADGQAFAAIELPENRHREVERHSLHPGLLDACFQTIMSLLPDKRESQEPLFLAAIDQIEFFARLPAKIFARATLVSDQSARNQWIGDLDVVDRDGQLLVRLTGVLAKRRKAQVTRDASKLLYELDYEKISMRSSPPLRGNWLILDDGSTLVGTLEQSLSRESSVTTTRVKFGGVSPGWGSELLTEKSDQACNGIFVCLDVNNEQRPAEYTLELMRKMIFNLKAHSFPVWFITRGLLPIEHDLKQIELRGTSINGLINTFFTEHNELRGGHLDLASNADDSHNCTNGIKAIQASLDQAQYEDRLVCRHPNVFAPRLKPLSDDLTKSHVAFSKRGSYLITGGFGGLGVDLAAWLIEHGARNILLTGRSTPTDALRLEVGQLNRGEAAVQLIQLDVCDYAGLEKTIAEHCEVEKLRGVFHMAGIVEDHLLSNLSPSNLNKVLSPKTIGAWNLHSVTRELNLEYFVLFSSAAAILGPSGQANHAAANAYLDALAHFRAQQGLSSLSVNLGLVEDSSKAINTSIINRLKSRGMMPLNRPQTFEALGLAMSSQQHQVTLINVDWREWRRSYISSPPAVLEYYCPDNQVVPLLPATDDEASASVQMLSHTLRFELSQLLQMDAQQIEADKPLGDYGLDSLMSIDLKERIDALWRVNLPVTELFEKNTINQLIQKILDLKSVQSAKIVPLPVQKRARSDETSVSSTAKDDLLEDKLLTVLSKLLKLSPQAMGRTRPLGDYGLDSLMSIELKELIDAEIGLTISSDILIGDLSLEELVARVTRDSSNIVSVNATPKKVMTHTAEEKLNSIRQQYRTLNKCSYLNYGAAGPIAQGVLEAMSKAEIDMQDAIAGTREGYAFVDFQLIGARKLFASELAVSEANIALTENISSAVSIVLWGKNWSEGDHIVVADEENPGIMIAVKNLAKRKNLDVTIAQTADSAEPIKVLENAINKNTKLVVVSHVFWQSGRALSLQKLSRLKEKGVEILLDAAQSFGVMAMGLAKNNIDYCAVTAGKWMCGPPGLAALYVAKPQALEPTSTGWRALNPQQMCEFEDARKFETGSTSYAVCAGFRAALKQHEAFGTKADRFTRIVALTQSLRRGVADLAGFELVVPKDAIHGIVTMRCKNVSASLLVRLLAEQNIIAKALPDNHCIRLCVHYLTLTQEVDHVLSFLRNIKNHPKLIHGVATNDK